MKLTELTSALRPFANVELPPEGSGSAVWIYVGKEDPTNSSNPPHLRVSDFRKAKKVLEKAKRR